MEALWPLPDCFPLNADGRMVRELMDQEPFNPSFANTCYSLITPDNGIRVTAVYRYKDGAQAGVDVAGGRKPIRRERGIEEA